MKVLMIGSGGREHAIAWKFRQSPLLSELYLAPGNDAMSSLGKLVPINVGFFRIYRICASGKH